MTAIEIARKMSALGQTEDAVQAYGLSLQGADEPLEELEAASYILDHGGDYRVSYTSFVSLYNRGLFRDMILPLLEKVFYEPNIKLLKSRYERNCKLLSKYPYLFRTDLPAFDQLPIRFFPYDDHHGYIPFDPAKDQFQDFVNVRDPVISRNFFKNLEDPVLATDVFSQYELEYLNDNVRPSEWAGRENHLYLHYSDWETFCAWLQVLNVKPLVESGKAVFLIEDERFMYPIDFKERFGIDYSQYPVRPVRIREVTRMIWHTQLSTHNGGDMFNEVFDHHPNLLAIPSIMFSNVEEAIASVRKALTEAPSLPAAVQTLKDWGDPRLVEELYHMRDLTDKDILVATYMCEKDWNEGVDWSSRVAPAIFFQPHFFNIVYRMRASQSGAAVLESDSLDKIHASPIFRGFKYIKTFTPMRRFTTSHAATVKFMYASAQKPKGEDGKEIVVSDAITQRILNRSFMIDPEDRLYKDSILVRFEDGKLNPKATFTALAAFLDLPYTESMTCCSERGNPVPYLGGEYAPGFDPVTVYRTYDEYINDSERYFIEYFLRDAYEFYGYDFQWYDGQPVDEEKLKELVDGFTTMDSYMRKTWRKVFAGIEVSKDGERVDQEVEGHVQDQLLENYLRNYHRNRLENGKVLLEGLRFVNKNGQPLYMMPKLQLDPALLEQPLYH